VIVPVDIHVSSNSVLVRVMLPRSASSNSLTSIQTWLRTVARRRHVVAVVVALLRLRPLLLLRLPLPRRQRLRLLLRRLHLLQKRLPLKKQRLNKILQDLYIKARIAQTDAGFF
jgi:hypothetical protein